ncbi:MAG: gamma-glutamyltransferase family protein [Armatimonadetes bacterium]|nr:gamma-glutamyltransferase family protein [Armatimonadota bacterium]
MPREAALGEPTAAFHGARSQPSFTTRPTIAARRGVVAAGHYLAAAAGLRILQAGGNAIDAGVAAGLVVGLVEPHSNGLGGESPLLIYHAKTGRVAAINGQGTAPRAMTIDWFRQRGIRLIPGDGLLPAMVPSQIANWITALAEFGTLSFEAVATPALELAEDGFPVSYGLRQCLVANERRFREEWPSSAAVYLPGGRVPDWGDPLPNPDWAATLRQLIAAEREGARRGRAAGLDAACDAFYRGPIAARIAAFAQNTAIRDATGAAHRGFLNETDLAEFHARVEEPVTFHYRGIDVYKCGPWCQGPVFLQQLALLEGFNLRALGHNTADYLHVWLECAKLAFADREFYYGDPQFVDVPLGRLLSREYNDQRRNLVDMGKASLALRPGDAGPRPARLILGEGSPDGHDTTHLDVIDAEGNMIAATPSGGWIPSSPVIPGIGFPLGTRGQMFSLDPEHPNRLEPGKRPRTTLTPSLAMHRDRPFLVWGTPGGDQQDQWTLQFFLNVVEFGMTVQQALDAPTAHTTHFPSSFYPRVAYPGQVVLEEGIPAVVCEALRCRGHEVVIADRWANGRVMGILRDEARGVLFGGCSPRGEHGYAIGW